MANVSRLANADDFHARYNPDGTAVAGTGLLYTDYAYGPMFKHRAQLIQSIFPPVAGRKVVVAGCAYGFLVHELVQLGYDAWGFDGAQYAVGAAQAQLSRWLPALGFSAPYITSIVNRLQFGNVATLADLNAVKSAAGVANNSQFEVCIVEDLHSTCQTDNEVGVGLTSLRRVQSGRRSFTNQIFHIITAIDQGRIDSMNGLLPGLLWKTMAQWRELINFNNTSGQNEPIMGAEGPPYQLDRGSGAIELWNPPAAAGAGVAVEQPGPSKLTRLNR